VGVVGVVIAGGHDQEAGADLGRRAGFIDEGEAPERGLAVPVGMGQALAEADEADEVVVAGDAVEIGADGGAFGHGIGGEPGREIEAERVHVAVGAQAGIGEQIPGAPTRARRSNRARRRPGQSRAILAAMPIPLIPAPMMAMSGSGA
jgi:hypothetical protein